VCVCVWLPDVTSTWAKSSLTSVIKIIIIVIMDFMIRAGNGGIKNPF